MTEPPALRRSGDAVSSMVAVVAAGIAGAVAGCSPTGTPAWDMAIAGLFSTVIVVVAPFAPRWVLAPLVLPALVLGAPLMAQAAAVGATVALIADGAGVRSPILRSAGASMATFALLRISPTGFFGLPSIVVAVSLLPLVLFIAGWVLRHQPARRVVLSFCAIAALLAVGAGLQVERSRVSVMQASSASVDALEAAQDGDFQRSAARLHDTGGALSAARDRLDAWWLTPARMVPLVAQNLRALETATSHGATVANYAASVANSADIERMRMAGGGMDLSLLRQARGSLEELESSVIQAQAAVVAADSPWLVTPVSAKLARLLTELDRAKDTTARATLGATAMPLLLGEEGPRRYLVLFANPSEARELGGIVASYLELEAVDGRLRVSGSGSAGELNRRPPSTLQDPSAYPVRFIQNDPERFATNWAGMVDLPSVSPAVAELYATRGGRPIDGVLYLDPHAVGGLLSLTGPVDVPQLPYALASDNVVDFLLSGQYRLFDDHDARRELLTDIASAAFDRLLSRPLPGPQALEAAFGPLVRGGHLQMESLDPRPRAFLEAVHLRRPFPTYDGADVLAVVHANGAANKLDTYLRRSLDYETRIDAETGRLSARATVTLRNEAPRELPEYVLGVPVGGVPGTNLVQLSIYTPHALEEVRVDGQPVPFEAQVELGYSRYLLFASVPPGGSVDVSYDLSGRIDVVQGYRLTVVRQPTVHPDEVALRVHVDGATITGTAGALAGDGADATGRFELWETTTVVADFG